MTRTTTAPSWLPLTRAVLLDMDGTLVDSDAHVERAWRAWSAEYGVDAERVMAIQPGRAAVNTVRAVRPDLDDAAVDRAAGRQSDLQLVDAPATTPLPGAHELLATLDRIGLPWAVATGAVRRLALARLRAAAIDPPILVTVDEVAKGKPAPDCFLLAARRVGVAPAHCLVVEDARAGIEAGQAAGARVAALRGLPADLAIADLHALAALLERGQGGGGTTGAPTALRTARSA
jgi:HAD superfamily hydrolase (TIGR01509 family)